MMKQWAEVSKTNMTGFLLWLKLRSHSSSTFMYSPGKLYLNKSEVNDAASGVNVAGDTRGSAPPLTHVLTGLSSWPARSLANSAGGALALTGGGLGGCRWAWTRAGATGEVRLTYSDRSISNWGTQEPTSQTREEPEEAAHEPKTATTWHVDGHTQDEVT